MRSRPSPNLLPISLLPEYRQYAGVCIQEAYISQAREIREFVAQALLYDASLGYAESGIIPNSAALVHIGELARLGNLVGSYQDLVVGGLQTVLKMQHPWLANGVEHSQGGQPG